MGLDASLILQGRAPNILGSMAQGMQLRAARDDMQHGNALRAFLAQNGQAVMNGEPNALGQYAALAGPEAALGVQTSRLGMDATRLNMDVARHGMAYDDARLGMARDEVARQAAEAARQMSEAQRQQAAEALQATLTAAGFAYQRGPEAFARFVASRPDLADVTYENYPMHAAEAKVAAETIAGFTTAPERDIRSVDGVGLVEVPPTGAPSVLMPERPDPGKAVGPNGLNPKEQLDAENAFRDDWTSLPEVKDYSGVSRAYSTIVASAQQKTGAGDIALITGLQKLLDPTSVVREQEFATAANAGGTLAWLQAQAERVANGQMLTDDTRAQIVGLATAIQREAEQRIGGLRGQYEGIAERKGMDPMDVMPGVRYSPTYRGAPPFAPVARPQSRPGDPSVPPPPPLPEGIDVTPEEWPTLWRGMTPEERALWQ